MSLCSVSVRKSIATFIRALKAAKVTGINYLELVAVYKRFSIANCDAHLVVPVVLDQSTGRKARQVLHDIISFLSCLHQTSLLLGRTNAFMAAEMGRNSVFGFEESEA